MSFKFASIASIAAGFGMAIVVTAQAQQPSAAAPLSPAAPMNCPDPGDPPIDRTGADGPRFQKRVDSYKNCVHDYSQANIAKANALIEQSRVYSDAANKAVDEFNKYVADKNLNGKKPVE